ncbi:hypothetical protein V6N13_129934 [Hibiscus sabdariffa]|uniref:Uncharacterized protein n=1 Tax=Hibiscus sabdariffa TaxID=183260 RepID=A0ABR2SMZ0_9ROSI
MGGRGVQRSSLILKKRVAREPSNASLARRISALESELTAAQAEVASPIHEDLPPMSSMDSNVVWRANSTFEQPTASDMQG